MILKLVDVNNQEYEIENPKADTKTFIDSINVKNGFIEVQLNMDGEDIPTFLAIDKIVSIREISQKELEDLKLLERLGF